MAKLVAERASSAVDLRTLFSLTDCARASTSAMLEPLTSAR